MCFIMNKNEKEKIKKDNENNEQKQMKNMMTEVGEDATKYGEFVSSYFAWVSLPQQKENVEKLENITKNKDKKR